MGAQHFTVDGSGLTVRVSVGIVSLCGELDVASCATLRSALDRCGPGDLVLDLARLSFLDAAGIGCVVDEVNRRRGVDQRVIIRQATPAVGRLLALVGLSNLIVMAPPQRHRPRPGVGAPARQLGRLMLRSSWLPLASLARARFGGVPLSLSRASMAIHRPSSPPR